MRIRVIQAGPSAPRGVTMSATAASSPQVLSAREVRVVRAIGQALFPRDKLVDVDAVDAGVVAYIDDWLVRVGPTERVQFHALIRAFDVGYPVWAKDPTARLDAARVEDRRAYIESWERSATYLQRMLWEGLRGMFLFAYVDNPDVLSAIGVPVPPNHGAVDVADVADVSVEPVRAASGGGERR